MTRRSSNGKQIRSSSRVDGAGPGHRLGWRGQDDSRAQARRRTAAALIHLDAHYWKSGWVATPTDEWEDRVRSLASQPRWVMDGNYGGTLDFRLAACDTVVFLDMPRRVSLWRAFRRWMRYWGRTRPDVAPGCPERFTWSFFVWIWTYPVRRRGPILHKLGALQHTRVFVLSSQDEVDAFLKRLAA